jgi:hypothetical protein
VGDDSVIQELSGLLAENDTPPNVYFWLKQTRKALKAKWEKTTRKWPDPWLPWEGRIERLEGDLIVGKTKQRAKFTLWRREGFRNDQPDWGGSARCLKIRW